MDLLASLKAEGLCEFASVWICFPSFQVSQLTCNCIAWKACMFSWGKLRFWLRGGVNSFSFFLSSCGNLRRWRPLPLGLCLLTKSLASWLRDEVHWVNIPYPLSENLKSEYPRGIWPDFLISNWRFLGKPGITVQHDFCAAWFNSGILPFFPSKQFQLFSTGSLCDLDFSLRNEIQLNFKIWLFRSFE